MPPLIRRRLGHHAYIPIWRAMQRFTEQRDAHSSDELWLVEHPPVYTQGLNGKAEHLLNPSDIPVVAVDRGGQITYHGPGQAVVYCLLDLPRRGMGIRELVSLLENAVIALLADHGIDAHARPEAPGVYVKDAKIAALGLRVRRGRSYHGLSLNVTMDLEPFTRINPCGYAGLQVTQLADLCPGVSLDPVATGLLNHLGHALHSESGEEVHTLPPSALQEHQHV